MEGRDVNGELDAVESPMEKNDHLAEALEKIEKRLERMDDEFDGRLRKLEIENAVVKTKILVLSGVISTVAGGIGAAVVAALNSTNG